MPTPPRRHHNASSTDGVRADGFALRWAGLRQRSTILLLAALAWLLELLDGASAVSMMQQLGPAAELNPLVREVFRASGPPGVMLLKFASATLVITLFVVLDYRRRPILARISLLVTIALASLG